MAESIARRLAVELGMSGVSVSSAGTSAWDGAAASDGALLVAMENQMDLSAHRARVLSREIVDAADLILAMSPHHVDRVSALGGGDKVHILTDFSQSNSGGDGVADPFGGDLDTYRITFAELADEMRKVFERLATERRAEGG